MSVPLPPSAPFSPRSRGARTRETAARILWAAIPFWTVGLAGWAPAVHIARRRRTRAAWWWVAALAASTVAEVVVVELIPKNAGIAESFIGDVVVLGYLITATVYAWRGCGPDLPPLRSPQAAAHLYPYPYPHPGYGDAVWQPEPFGSEHSMSFPAPTLPYPGAPVGAGIPVRPAPPTPAVSHAIPPTPAVSPVPAAAAHDMAAHDMAAEIQADLRELRGFLGDALGQQPEDAR